MNIQVQNESRDYIFLSFPHPQLNSNAYELLAISPLTLTVSGATIVYFCNYGLRHTNDSIERIAQGDLTGYIWISWCFDK